jgi:ABC-type microcin C transport system permease subunit YejE
MLTHAGISYSRSFVNSLVVMPVLVSLVMQVLNNNLVTAFGLMAIFAIVRFQNILRDTRRLMSCQ